MTDKEIIQALEICKSDTLGCVDCAYYEQRQCEECLPSLMEDLLDLINRQQAEIERLTINMNAFGLGMKREKEKADTIKAEAIKEFAERLKWELAHIVTNVTDMREVVDNLVKEMVGEDK